MRTQAPPHVWFNDINTLELGWQKSVVQSTNVKKQVKKYENNPLVSRIIGQITKWVVQIYQIFISAPLVHLIKHSLGEHLLYILHCAMTYK